MKKGTLVKLNSQTVQAQYSASSEPLTAGSSYYLFNTVFKIMLKVVPVFQAKGVPDFVPKTVPPHSIFVGYTFSFKFRYSFSFDFRNGIA